MTRTVGVEEEFLVLRSDGPELAERGDEVVRAAQSRDADGQYEHELKQAQVELGSSPATALTGLRADLHSLRGELADAAEGHAARLVASGTSPRLEAARVTPEHRYRDMTDEYGLVARQQLTCGMHLHVGVDSPDEGIRVLDGPSSPTSSGSEVPATTRCSTSTRGSRRAIPPSSCGSVT